jgi:hypothetical protein
LSSKLDPYRTLIHSQLLRGSSQRELAPRYRVARSTLQAWLEQNPVPEDPGFTDGLREDTDMEVEIPVIVRDYSDLNELYVYPLGDVHIGSDKHAAGRWAEWLKYLEQEPKASMMGTGDFLNCALKGSKSEAYDDTLTVGKARESLSDGIAALAAEGRVDIMIPGNHEERVYRLVGDEPIASVTREHGIPYSRGPVVLIYKVGDVEYTVFLKHGRGGGQIGARANRLAQQARTLVADVYVSGHTHSQLVFPQELFVVQDRKVKRMRQLFISSGSFLNYELYAAEAGLPPTKIGAPRIRLDGTRHDAHVSV